jgi:hypothetical protein
MDSANFGERPPPEIAAVLRAVLPLELHHLVEPLARHLVAAAEFRILASDPATSPSVEEALTILSGKEIALPTGVSLSFGQGNTLGDVTLRDVAGRDIVNVTIVQLAKDTAGLDETQRQILTLLNSWSTFNQPVHYQAVARHLKLDPSETWDEIVLLSQRDLVYRAITDDDLLGAELAPAGRKYLRTHSAAMLPETSLKFGLNAFELSVLRTVADHRYGVRDRAITRRLRAELPIVMTALEWLATCEWISVWNKGGKSAPVLEARIKPRGVELLSLLKQEDSVTKQKAGEA